MMQNIPSQMDTQGIKKFKMVVYLKKYLTHTLLSFILGYEFHLQVEKLKLKMLLMLKIHDNNMKVHCNCF